MKFKDLLGFTKFLWMQKWKTKKSSHQKSYKARNFKTDNIGEEICATKRYADNRQKAGHFGSSNWGFLQP